MLPMKANRLSVSLSLVCLECGFHKLDQLLHHYVGFGQIQLHNYVFIYIHTKQNYFNLSNQLSNQIHASYKMVPGLC